MKNDTSTCLSSNIFQWLSWLLTGSLLVSSNAQATPQTGIPALLQFAEQYQKASEDTSQKLPAPSGEKTSPVEGKIKKSAERGARWQTKDKQIQLQQMTIHQLEREISTLKNTLATNTAAVVSITPPPPQPTVDLQSLGKLAQGLRQALALSPTEAQAKDRLQQALRELGITQTAQDGLRTENRDLKRQLSNQKDRQDAAVREASATFDTRLRSAEQDKLTLQTHLSESNKNNQNLNVTAENLKAQLARAKSTETALRDAQTQQQQQQQQQQDELKQKYSSLQAQWNEKASEVVKLADELATLKQNAPARIQADSLKNPTVRQDYAAGVSLGEEILQMQAERQRWGINVDKDTLLAGVIDTFAGRRQLNETTLNQALSASEKQVTQARDRVVATQTKQDATYLSAFKKDKGVKATASGAWYRIDYAGDNAIPADATLDVIVKEMLTDGTVIQDMESSGAVLSQPLSQFPPLFSDALSQLKNHGALTLVVPPELAYGEKGYPPNVPPNATMVYILRIAEVYPNALKKKKPEAVSQ